MRAVSWGLDIKLHTDLNASVASSPVKCSKKSQKFQSGNFANFWGRILVWHKTFSTILYFYSSTLKREIMYFCSTTCILQLLITLEMNISDNKSVDILFFFSCQLTQHWMYPTSKYCLSIKAWYILFLCAIELHCCPKTIKNTSVSHTVALGEMFLHYCEHTHTHCSLLWLNLTYTILLL